MSGNGNKTTILAVDDRPDNLFILQKVIKDRLPECTVLTAGSAAAGLSIADDTPIDGALIDVQMPDMNGTEMCRRLKANSATAHIPVILMTAHSASPAQKATGLDAGADDFINKPIDNTELIARLRAIIRIKKTEDQLRQSAARLAALAERRNRQLAESENYYRSLLYNLHEDIIVIDSNYVITDINNSYLATVGRSAEDVIGRCCYEIPHDFDNPCDQYGQECPLRKVFDTGLSHHCQHTHTGKDGTKVYVDILASPMKDDDGNVTHIVEAIRNITPLMKAQAKHRQYAQIVSSTTDMLAMLDKDYVYLAANEAYLQAFDKTSDEVIGRTAAEVFGEEFFFANIKPRADHCLAGANVRYQEWFDFPAGRKYMDVAYSPYLGPDAEPLGFVVSGRDITEVKRVGEERNAVLQTAMDGFWIADETGRLMDVNDAYREMTGYTRDELLDMNISDVEDSESAEDTAERIQQIIAEGSDRFETRHRCKDGRIIDVEVSTRYMSDSKRFSVFLRDITDRKRMERNALILRTAVDQAPLGIALADGDLNLYYCNPAGLGMRGDANIDLVEIPKEAFDNWQVLTVNGEPYEIDNLPLVRAVKEGLTIREEFIVKGQDGSARLCDAIASPIFEDEKIIGGMVFFPDITERKLAEEDRERLMSAIGQAAEVVVITDVEGTIQYVNPAFERITGYTPEEAVGRNPRFLKSGEHDEAFYKEMWDMLIGGQTWNGRFINKKKDGTLYTEEAVISPVVNASGKTVNYVAVKRDITEEIKMEEQYRQAQKMEAVGRLAAGVAHDFNNQLQVILGYCDILMMDRQPGDPQWDPIVQVRQAADRARSTTSHLLSFSRRQILEPELVDVAELLHDMEKPVGRMIGEDVKLVIAVPPGVRPLLIDKSGLHQAIMNLAVNARDAMPDGGKLVIQSSNVTLDHVQVADFPEAEPGDYVLLEVIDSGVGMDAETLEHLFEPFFTTKEQGKGTGLGMPMVQGFVGQSKGFIRIDSQPGKGTAVQILLPQAPSDSQSGKTDQAPPRIEKATEGVTIMIVEDEQAVRSFLTRLLERTGYSVLTAAMPSEAMALIQGDGPKPDLVISDVIMPEIRGDQLAEKMQLLDESLRFLFISGYGNIDVGGHDIIRKPFKSEDILERVRKALFQNR
jgi:two-component system, cell cycle sensor histidine kinase and response regulator CckA